MRQPNGVAILADFDALVGNLDLRASCASRAESDLFRFHWYLLEFLSGVSGSSILSAGPASKSIVRTGVLNGQIFTITRCEPARTSLASARRSTPRRA